MLNKRLFRFFRLGFIVIFILIALFSSVSLSAENEEVYEGVHHYLEIPPKDFFYENNFNDCSKKLNNLNYESDFSLC